MVFYTWSYVIESAFKVIIPKPVIPIDWAAVKLYFGGYSAIIYRSFPAIPSTIDNKVLSTTFLAPPSTHVYGDYFFTKVLLR